MIFSYFLWKDEERRKVKADNSGPIPLEYFILGVCLIVFSLKTLLIPAYTSTDFEVHRNWMAVTHNLPLEKWYHENTSEWTLDYPPFFGYMEYGLAYIAKEIGYSDILVIQKEALCNDRVLLFQRLSVIAMDSLFALSCIWLCFDVSLSRLYRLRFIDDSQIDREGYLTVKTKMATFMLLISNVWLIILDNIHFQYNSMLTLFLILAIRFVDKRQFLLSGFFFCILINFKHIYLYYAPAFVFFFLREYFDIPSMLRETQQFYKGVWKAVYLAITLLIPFVVSLYPFIARDGISAVQQIASRLFPISRGLTHAYWAPNFWALYNVVDLLLYKIANLFKLGSFIAPTYSSGLVQVYDHSVLPSISPLISLCLILFGLSPLAFVALKRSSSDLCIYLILSSYSFFFFGYHVHEKALILISIPLLILALRKAKYIRVFVFFSAVTTFSLFPLLFTPLVIPLKYALGTAYFLLILLIFRSVFHLRLHYILPFPSLVYISGLVVVEIYNTLLHRLILGDRLPFLPLMIISVYNAIGVLITYLWILKLSMDDGDGFIKLKKKACEMRESLIRDCLYSVRDVDSLDDVHLVGGVDITAVHGDSDVAVVALSILEFPSMKLQALYDDVIVVTEPYISGYLAIREAQPIADFVDRILSQSSTLRPDVLICDGNGRFHSRGCGVACHIGALTGIPTVGVAKTFNNDLLKSLGADKKMMDKVERVLMPANQMNLNGKAGYAPFDAVIPVVMNIIKSPKSKECAFVSAGYGIELDLSTEIVLQCFQTKVCEPIRQADLHSRSKVLEYFDTSPAGR